MFDEVVYLKSETADTHRFTVRVGGTVTWAMTSLVPVARQDFGKFLFYGGNKELNPGACGLSDYYNTANPDKAQNAVMVMDCDSKTNLRTSVWLVGWEKDKIAALTADGLPPDGTLKTTGLLVKDWRYAARAANIDPRADSPIDMGAILPQMMYRIPNLRAAKFAFYMGRSTHKLMIEQEMDLEFYRNIPIRVCDEIRLDEMELV